MARCDFCGAETQLFDAGTPICIPCSDKRYEELKKRELEALLKSQELHGKPSQERLPGDDSNHPGQ